MITLACSTCSQYHCFSRLVVFNALRDGSSVEVLRVPPLICVPKAAVKTNKQQRLSTILYTDTFLITYKVNA